MVSKLVRGLHFPWRTNGAEQGYQVNLWLARMSPKYDAIAKIFIAALATLGGC
jgi:hypothetical protein